MWPAVNLQRDTILHTVLTGNGNEHIRSRCLIPGDIKASRKNTATCICTANNTHKQKHTNKKQL